MDSAQVVQSVQCSSCATNISPTYTYCPNCGGRFTDTSGEVNKAPIIYCSKDFSLIESHQSYCPKCRAHKNVVGAKADSIEELERLRASEPNTSMSAFQIGDTTTESTINSVVYCKQDLCIIEPYQSYCPQCRGHKNMVGAKANSVAALEAQIAAKSSNVMSESQVASEYPTKVLCPKCQKVLVSKGLEMCRSCMDKKSNLTVKIVAAAIVILIILFKAISADHSNNSNSCASGQDQFACLGTPQGIASAKSALGLAPNQTYELCGNGLVCTTNNP